MIKYINNKLKNLIHRWLFVYNYDVIVNQDARLPTRMFKNDAGYDLFVLRSICIPKRKMVNVPTGVFCKSNKIPAWILLTGRSSTLHRHGLIVNNGIIDGDYIGEMFISVYNPTGADIWLYPNMRIGQMIVIPHTTIKFSYVDKFNIGEGERGECGFGSTGK